MSSTTVSRPHAVLHLEKTKILPLLAGARTVYNAMLAAVAHFPSPVPTLAELLGQINALDTTQQAVSSRSGATATTARNTARDALWISLGSEKAYVQTVANAAAAEDAVEIIKSAGFDVELPHAPPSKPILDAKLTVTSGAVKLVANASALAGTARRRAVYNWQYSLDGGHTWVSAPSTNTASTTVVGLPLVTSCTFRVSVTLKGVMQPWSQVVTLLVH